MVLWLFHYGITCSAFSKRAGFALGPLTKFLLTSFTVLREGKKPNSCDIPQIGVFG